MQEKSIDTMIDRAKALGECTPLTTDEIFMVEKELNIKLPKDFIDINLVHSYEFISSFSFYNFGLTNNQSVIDETLYYRKNYNLSGNYLVLFSDDVSFVLLKITSKDKSEVIWCNYMDFFNLCAGNPFNYKVTTFSSFAEFYKFLLDEEEKIRAEERG